MSGRKKGGGASGGGSKASNESSPSKAPVDTSAMFADLLNLQASGDFDKALKVSHLRIAHMAWFILVI